MPETATYSIGQLVRELGVPAETIRYYEHEGLLPRPARSSGNYRRYSASHRDRLSFIRNCRALDMTLAEVRALLEVRDAPDKSCAEVNELIDVHIGHVTERMAELRRLREQLQLLRERCGTIQRGGDCAILKELANTKPAKRKDPKRNHLA